MERWDRPWERSRAESALPLADISVVPTIAPVSDENESMPPFQRHVFVCLNQRASGHPKGCCSDKGSSAIREALKTAAKRRGLQGFVRINEAGCLDQCEHGVTIVVYPEAVWYGFVKLTDIEEIVQSHLVEGRPVERLRLADECINTPSCKHRLMPPTQR